MDLSATFYFLFQPILGLVKFIIVLKIFLF